MFGKGIQQLLLVTPVPTLPPTSLFPFHTSCGSVGEGQHLQDEAILGCMHELVVRRIRDPYRASVTKKKRREKRAVLVDNPCPQEREDGNQSGLLRGQAACQSYHQGS